jgi:DNA invertase Pin-like site-specific DNA recombinase
MPRCAITPPSTRFHRAAQYLRMSTGHQQYSIANQSAAIALYAAAHNIAIVCSFIDEGKTGTTIKRRIGLQTLLRVVESGNADIDRVLVYDVSRWGRFLDSDEAAHYEYLCSERALLFIIAPSNLRTTTAPLPICKRLLSARWPGNTAASYR